MLELWFSQLSVMVRVSKVLGLILGSGLGLG